MANTIKKLGLAALLAAMPVNYSNAKDVQNSVDKKWEFSIGPSFGFGLSSPAKDFLDSEYNKITSGQRTSGAAVTGASALDSGSPTFIGFKAEVDRKLNDKYSIGGSIGYQTASQSANTSGTTGFPVDAKYDIKTSNLSFGAKGKMNLLDERVNPYVGLNLNMAKISGDYTITWSGAAVRTYAGSISASKVMPSLELGADGKAYKGLFWDASMSLPLGNSMNANWTETRERAGVTNNTNVSSTFKMPAQFKLGLKWLW
jgi:hypothetical protein